MGNKNKFMKILMGSMMNSHHCRFLSIRKIKKDMDKMTGSLIITIPIRCVECSVTDREDKTVKKKALKG